MRELRGEASTTVAATIEDCLAFLAAIDRYPDWHPDVVREAAVLAMTDDGAPSRAQVTLHVSRGPIERDFRLLMDVSVVPPSEVTLTRIPHEPSDGETFAVRWEIEEQGERRNLLLAVAAKLAVPRLLPLGSIGDELAAGFVAAAARALAAGGHPAGPRP